VKQDLHGERLKARLQLLELPLPLRWFEAVGTRSRLRDLRRDVGVKR